MNKTYTNEEIEQKLANLRTQWINDPSDRKIYETQAKLLNTALSIRHAKQPNQQLL